MDFIPALFQSLCEDPRLVHFVINIFMMEYDLNSMSWVKSHIWIPWCERDLIIPVWGKSEIKKWPSWPNLMVCSAVFSHFLPHWWPLKLLTTTNTWLPWKALWSHKKLKQRDWPWCGGQVTASPLHCGLRSHIMFYGSAGLENNKISVHSQCQHYLNNALKQC